MELIDKLEKAADKDTCWEESISLIFDAIEEIKQLQVELGKARKTSIECLEQTTKYKAENDELRAKIEGLYKDQAGIDI